ncbi:hypothetical protein BJX61DRAFT_457722 [Aspergillus egyptiacus]|nr:hypothetical protein BJX61DRAFT_457722 [Aspergillus egyptiacus]
MRLGCRSVGTRLAKRTGETTVVARYLRMRSKLILERKYLRKPLECHIGGYRSDLFTMAGLANRLFYLTAHFVVVIIVQSMKYLASAINLTIEIYPRISTRLLHKKIHSLLIIQKKFFFWDYSKIIWCICSIPDSTYAGSYLLQSQVRGCHRYIFPVACENTTPPRSRPLDRPHWCQAIGDLSWVVALGKLYGPPQSLVRCVVNFILSIELRDSNTGNAKRTVYRLRYEIGWVLFRIKPLFKRIVHTESCLARKRHTGISSKYSATLQEP